MKRVLSVLLVFVMLTGLCACGSVQSKINKFDRMVNAINEYYEYRGDDDDSMAGKAKKVADRLLERFGFGNDEITCKIDEEFIEAYLENHSAEEFLEELERIDMHINDRFGKAKNDTKEMREIVMTVAEVLNAEVNTLRFDNQDEEGWYSVHEAPNGGIPTLYGDFAVVHQYGRDWDEGRLEWSGGRFYDEHAHWDYYDNYRLYFKDARVMSCTKDEGGQSQFTQIKYFNVGDATCLIYSDGNQEALNLSRTFLFFS